LSPVGSEEEEQTNYTLQLSQHEESIETQPWPTSPQKILPNSTRIDHSEIYSKEKASEVPTLPILPDSSSINHDQHEEFIKTQLCHSSP
jgi:hypothetical protein